MPETSKGSLRIVTAANNTIIYPEGYVGLTEDYFALTEPQLKKIEKKNQPAIDFLTKSGTRFVKDKQNRLISKATNKIKIMIDEDDDEDEKTRTHISLPSEHIDHVDKLQYLDDYIGIIKTLVADGSVAGNEKTRKFLFGLMMITKCR